MSQEPEPPGLPDGEFDPQLKKHLLHDMEVEQKRVRLERSIHRCLISFAVALLSILFMAIWVSTIRPRIILQAHGDGMGGDGQPTAIRVTARDPKGGALLVPGKAELILQTGVDPDGVQQKPVQSVVLSAESVSAALFISEQEVADNARLLVRVQSEDLNDHLLIPIAQPAQRELGVVLEDASEVLQKPEQAEGAIDQKPKLPKIGQGEERVEVRFYPESGQLVPVLGNEILVLALKDGKPQPGVRLRVEPPGWNLTTDRLGLAQLNYTPGRDLGTLKLSPVTEASSGPTIEPAPVKVILAAPPSQLLARPRHRLVAPQESIEIDITSVRLRTWLSFEVYYGARLVAMSFARVDGGSAQLSIPAPELERSLVSVRLGRASVSTGAVTESTTVYVNSAAATQAYRHLVQDLGDLLNVDPGLQALAQAEPDSPKQALQLISLLLSRAKLLQQGPRLLADSTERNELRASERRQRWQRWLFGLYWVLAVGVLILACVAVIMHNRRQFQRMVALDEDDPAEALKTATKIRRRGYLELLSVVIAMLFGLFCFYYLLSNLWWG